MIEVGEFVRTKTGNITKVIKVKDTVIWTEEFIDGFCKYNEGVIDKNDIVKHSKFLIDLIECGDIVEYDSNNYGADIIEVVVETCSVDEDYEDRAGFICTTYDSEVRINEIKSILTREEFEMRKYKVKEN